MNIIDKEETPKKKQQRKTERSKEVAQAIVKAWELNGFVVRLS